MIDEPSSPPRDSEEGTTALALDGLISDPAGPPGAGSAVVGPPEVHLAPEASATPEVHVGAVTLETPDLRRATQLLHDLLGRSDGVVGTTKVKKELESAGLQEVADIIEKMRLAGHEWSPPIHHAGRSFLSADKYRDKQKDIENAAETAAAEAPIITEAEEEEDAGPAPRRRENRQEEARLVTYLVEELSNMYYSSEHAPDADCAFDVHNERAGGDFENVDAVAVDWRSKDIAEIVAVEAKLAFTAKLVQQANNYRRFADRVWIAVPVREGLETAASELRKTDAYLFDYVIECGLGILACRRGRGNRYDVLAVHWPRCASPSKLERQRFLDRNRKIFEAAEVLAPETSRRAVRFT